MNYAIVTTESFDRKIKQLAKKYRSIPDDLDVLKVELLANPKLGTDLGNNTRKVRMAITSKGRGKSGGARVITCNIVVSVDDTDIYLLTIYDKGEQDTIPDKEIEKLKHESGL
ncbi:toxin RelE [Bacteroidia bacterium]|nr:toxin RelE [Bacteroidia bacterium]GHT63308.1 toxin RelE [Bacteroidia bacterium]